MDCGYEVYLWVFFQSFFEYGLVCYWNEVKLVIILIRDNESEDGNESREKWIKLGYFNRYKWQFLEIK